MPTSARANVGIGPYNELKIREEDICYPFLS